MITLRMVGIAVAILLAIPITTVLADHAPGHLSVPGGEIFRGGAEAAATVTDIVLADLPQQYDRAVNEFRPEQLVEGHIVWITIDIPLIPNVSNFTFDIVGDIECTNHVNGTGPTFLGIPVPNRINEAHVECRAGETVFVTPDPFIDSDRTTQSTSTLQPTGRVFSTQAPNGEFIEVTEHTFDLITSDWLGAAEVQTMYAWSVPTVNTWTHSDGRTKSWFCPIPEDRLREMGITTFWAYHESELPAWMR